MAHYLIIGQGRIGKALTHQLAASSSIDGSIITAVSRRHHHHDAPNVRFLQKDARTLTANDVAGVTHIAIIVTPRSSSGARASAQDYQDSYLAICQHLAALYGQCAQGWPQLKQVLFVSSTSVYGENDGQLIDENSQAIPATDTAKVLRQAEIVLQETFADRVVIVRPGGIYHLDSTRLINEAAQAHLKGVPSHHYTNRIMDSDLVMVLGQILRLPSPKPVYLATDGESLTRFSVLSFIAAKMGYLPPKRIDAVASGKRIRPNIDPDWLTFADFRSGYQAVMAKYITSNEVRPAD